MTSSQPELRAIINKSDINKDGTIFHLKSRTDFPDNSKPYKKITLEKRDRNKPHKTILLVGETGTGKTTLINVMVNYMLGVQRKDKVWFEITDEKSDRTSAERQTSSITVYEFYLQESPVDLTVIDTPGYGDPRGFDLDKEIAINFHNLIKSAEGVHKIDAVCLVMNAKQNRLSDRQLYIFDAVQSLFGSDIAENIVLLFTHSDGLPPRNALTALKEAGVKCAVNDNNQPVFFLFNNCQSDATDEEYKLIQEQTWDLSFRGMTGLFHFLENVKNKSLKMTQDVLHQWEQLEAKISILKSCVQKTELKRNELKQTQEALKQNKKHMTETGNFEYEVDVSYKEKADINQSVAKMAMCCTVCEENCHYPGCWWASDLSWCSVMENGHCRVCTGKCHYSKHVKESKIYVTKTKKEKRTFESLKKKYDGHIEIGKYLVKKMEEELQELKKEKGKHVIEVSDCVKNLQSIALNTESQFILHHADLLIENLKEMNKPEKAKTLEDMKKRAGKKAKDLQQYYH